MNGAKERQHFYFRKKDSSERRPCEPYFHRFYGARLICECGDRRLVQNGDRMRLVENRPKEQV